MIILNEPCVRCVRAQDRDPANNGPSFCGCTVLVLSVEPQFAEKNSLSTPVTVLISGRNCWKPILSAPSGPKSPSHGLKSTKSPNFHGQSYCFYMFKQLSMVYALTMYAMCYRILYIIICFIHVSPSFWHSSFNLIIELDYGKKYRKARSI